MTEDVAFALANIERKAQRRKVEVVAGSGEAREQPAFLRKYGCDVMHGYLLSKPVSAEEVLALLTANTPLTGTITYQEFQ